MINFIVNALKIIFLLGFLIFIHDIFTSLILGNIVEERVSENFKEKYFLEILTNPEKEKEFFKNISQKIWMKTLEGSIFNEYIFK